jgi:hypothetical protein
MYEDVIFISGVRDIQLASHISAAFSGSTAIESHEQFTHGKVLVILGGEGKSEAQLLPLFNASGILQVLVGPNKEGKYDGTLKIVQVNDLFNDSIKTVQRELKSTFNIGLNMA